MLEAALSRVSEDAIFSLVFAAFATLTPLCTWVLVGKGFGALSKGLGAGVLAVSAWVVHLLHAWTTAALGELGLSVAYLVAVALGFELVRILNRTGRMDALSTFMLAETAFVLGPAIAFKSSTGGLMTVIGFEFAFSAFSYARDAGRLEEPERTSALHFILVNPVLLYADRGRRTRSPRLTWRAFGRCAGGVVTLAAAQLVLTPAASSALVPLARIPHLSAFGYAELLKSGALCLMSLYLAHSGVASVRIGVMAMCGHDVPERYQFPVLAAGPRDFWRRWNTYLGRWMQRYVYVPTALALRKPLGLPGAGAFATFTVFVACGALHEAVLLARRGSFHGVVLAGFAGAGILCAISATLAPAKGFEDAGGGGLKKSLSWLATAPVAALLAAFIVPALAE